MNKKKLIVIWVISIQLLSILLSYAEELVDYNKENIRYIKADIDKDGVAEEISVITGELESGQDVCILSVKDGEELTTKALLIDYDISCNLSSIEIHPNLEPFIGVDYAMGAHTYALSLLRYREQGIDKYILEKVANFGSDKPSIQIRDTDEDGVKDIVVKHRDWRSDSLEDSYVEIYKYVDDGNWRSDSVFRTATGEYVSDSWNETNYVAKDIDEAWLWKPFEAKQLFILYKTPSHLSNRIGVVEKGMWLSLIDMQDGWYLLRESDAPYRKGWVSGGETDKDAVDYKVSPVCITLIASEEAFQFGNPHLYSRKDKMPFFTVVADSAARVGEVNDKIIDLYALGYSPHDVYCLNPGYLDNSNAYAVCVGAYKNSYEAEKSKEELKNKGYKSSILVIQK